jgi:hypothetical protein
VTASARGRQVSQLDGALLDEELAVVLRDKLLRVCEHTRHSAAAATRAAPLRRVRDAPRRARASQRTLRRAASSPPSSRFVYAWARCGRIGRARAVRCSACDTRLATSWRRRGRNSKRRR